MKKVKDATFNMLMILVALVIAFIMFVCIMTPEKTKYGYYTDPIKFWTSDAYVQENFDIKMEVQNEDTE